MSASEKTMDRTCARRPRGTPEMLRRRAEWFMGGALAFALSIPALAGPEGAQVVRGDVNITRNGSETLIRAGNNSIINYRSFDIGRNESVRFVQPNAQSRVLNRIESANPTRIDGSLTANGRVYLVNPAGVYFGQGAMVNVAGLYAGAAKITDRAFLRNINQFTDASGSVVNEGTIIGDFVGRVGKSVVNHGSIVAPQGAVVMGAGRDVFIGEGGGNVYVRVSGEAAGTPTQAAVTNTGTIDAKGGQVRVGVGDVYGAALFSSGKIRAKSARLEGQGKGEVKVAGGIDTSNVNGRGGDVRVLGERVVLDGATLDARGTTGGGEVLVGGNFQGKGAERNAERLSVNSTTSIHADATDRGDGGRVILWSNDRTDYAGQITARGGANACNGGFVEVSGKETLAFRGGVNAGADHGRGGHLLLDPRNITVQTGGPDAATGQTFGSTPASDVTIDPGTITTITNTGTGVTLQANNDITITDAIITNNAMGDGGDLILQAGRSILVNANITTDNGALRLNANASTAGADGSNRTVGAGNVTVANAVTLDTGTGALDITVDPAATAPFAPGGVALRAVNAGPVTISNTGGDVSLAGAVQAAGGFVSSGFAFNNTGGSIDTGGSVITLNHTGPATIAGNLNSNGGAISITALDATITSTIDADTGSISLASLGTGVTAVSGRVLGDGLRLTGFGTFLLSNTNNDIATLAASVNAGITYTDANSFAVGNAFGTFGITSSNNSVSLASGGTIALMEAINAGTGPISLVATTGVTQAASANVLANTLGLTGAGTYALTAPGNNVDSISAIISGSLAYNDADTLAVLGNVIDITGSSPALTLTTAGALTLSGNVRVIGGTATLQSGNGIAQGGLSALTVGSLRVLSTGDVMLNGTSNDAQTLAANVDGAFTYRDADALTIGSIGGNAGVVGATIDLNVGGELFAPEAMRALSGSLTARSLGRMGVGGGASATTSLTLWSGAGGTGDLVFDPAARVSAPIITLRAGDGMGGGGASASVQGFLAPGTGPFFTSTNLATSPTVFTIRQDAAISTPPLASQFAAGLSGMTYTLQSDEGAINLTSSTAPLSLIGADVILTPAGGSSANMTGEFSLNSLTVNGPLTLRGAISGANLTFTNLVTFDAALPSSLVATTGVIALQGGFNARNNATLRAREIDVGAASTGTGAITFTSSNATSILVGGAMNNAGDSVLDITQSEINFLAGGMFSSIRFGSSDYTGAITYMPMSPLVFSRPVEFRTDVGGSTTLAGDVLTNGQAIQIASDVVLGAPTIRVDTTNFGGAVNGADITFGGTINSDAVNPRAFTVQAGAAGNVSMASVVGGTRFLESIVVAGRTIALAGVRTNGTQAYVGDTTLSGLMSTTHSGMTFRGNVALAGDTTLSVLMFNTGQAVFIDGAIDSASSASPRSLTIQSNPSTPYAGEVAISGAIGSTAALQDLTIRSGNIVAQAITAGGLVNLTSAVTNTITNGLVTGGAITYDGGAIVNGGVSGGSVTFTGPAALFANVSGSTVAFNGPTVIGNDLIITGTNAVTFNNTLNSNAGRFAALTLRSPQVAFNGDVGTADRGVLNQLAVESSEPGRRVTIGGTGRRTLRVINDHSYQSDVVVATDTLFQSQATDVNFRARLDSEPGGTRRNVTVEAPGTATFGGAVGFLNPLQTLTTSAGANPGGTPHINRFEGAGVQTTGAQAYGGNTILASDAEFTGNAISFGGTVDSADATMPRRFLVNAGLGAASLGGNAGSTAQLGSVFVTGSTVSILGVRASGRQVYTGSTITLGGNVSSLASGDIRFDGATRLTRDVTVRTVGTAATDDISFSSAVDGVAGAFNLDAGAGVGDVFFGGSIGRINGASTPSIRDLRVRGASITTQAISTGGAMTFNGPTTLNADVLAVGTGGVLFNDAVTLNADSLAVSSGVGGITFARAVDSSPNTNRALTVTSTGGPVSLLGSVGGTTRLSSLNVNGTLALLVGPEIRTTSLQAYNAPVQMGGNIRYEGSIVTFGSTLDAASAAGRTATIVAAAAAGGPGQVNFLAPVGATFPLQALNVSTGIARVASNITTRNGIDFANAVNISGDSIMNAGNGGIFFRSTLDTLTDFVGSSLELRSNLAPTNDATPYRFGGSVGTTSPLGRLTIGSFGTSNGLPAPAQSASIVFTDAWDANGRIQATGVAPADSFEVRVRDAFVMGRNQKLTSFGSFLVRGVGSDASARTASATLGDITSLGSITIRADAIALNTRPGGTLLDNFGRTDRDTGLDFVAANRIDFSVRPTGGDSTVSFANNDAAVSSTLSGFIARQYTNGVAPVLFSSASFLLPLDLKSQGPSLANTATVLAGAIPRDEETRGTATPLPVDKALEEPLREMGLATRDLDPDEYLMTVVGTALYNDLSGRPSGGTSAVSARRLDRAATERAVESYRALVMDPSTDADGRALVDAKGRPIYDPQSKEAVTQRHREALGAAWSVFAGQTPNGDGYAFRAHLESRANDATNAERTALDLLNRLGDALDDIDAMGLGPAEALAPKGKLIEALRPTSMTAEQLKAAALGRPIAAR